MGYPGQPGGPGGWSPQNPGPTGPQHGGYGPPPGYGPPGQGYGPPPGQGYGPPAGQGGYQQQPGPGYGQHPGHAGYGSPQGAYGGPSGPYGGPPRRGKGPLIAAIGGGVGVLALIVVLVLVFTSGPSAGSTPEETARAVVAAFNDQDSDAVTELSCQQLRQEQDAAAASGGDQPLPTSDGDPDAEDVQATLGEVTDNGDGTATADVSFAQGAPPVQLKLVREDGGWYWCGFDVELPDLDLPEAGG